MRGLLERVDSLLSSDSDPQVRFHLCTPPRRAGAFREGGLQCRALTCNPVYTCSRPPPHHGGQRALGLLGALGALNARATSRPPPALLAQVVANCLYVLQQAGMLEGRVTRQLVISLLNHIRSFRCSPPPPSPPFLLPPSCEQAAGRGAAAGCLCEATLLPAHPPASWGKGQVHHTCPARISLPAVPPPCSDWAQCFVLELVSGYQPAGEQERFDILEVGASAKFRSFSIASWACARYQRQKGLMSGQLGTAHSPRRDWCAPVGDAEHQSRAACRLVEAGSRVLSATRPFTSPNAATLRDHPRRCSILGSTTQTAP